MEKYFKFDGSATRSEYWGVNVIAGVISFILAFIGVIVMGTGDELSSLLIGATILIFTFAAAIWISIATAVRRCRDANINIWWALAMCIPYIGWIVLIVLGVLKTDEGTK